MEPQRNAYVALSGELDIHNCDTIERLLPPPHTIDQLTIDCSRVTYMDTAALGVLIKYRGVFTFEHGETDAITIVAPRGPLRKIFEIVGFMRLFKVTETNQAEPQP